MKRLLYLATLAIPVLLLATLGDVSAGQVDGVKGEGGPPSLRF